MVSSSNSKYVTLTEGRNWGIPGGVRGSAGCYKKIDRRSGARTCPHEQKNPQGVRAFFLLEARGCQVLGASHRDQRVVVVDRCATLERLLGGRQRRACARPAALGVHCAGCATPWGPPSVQVEHSTLMVLQRRWEGRRREARGARCPGRGEGPSGALSLLIEATRGVPPQRRCGNTLVWVMMVRGAREGRDGHATGAGPGDAKGEATRCTRGGCMARVPVARHTEVLHCVLEVVRVISFGRPFAKFSSPPYEKRLYNFISKCQASIRQIWNPDNGILLVVTTFFDGVSSKWNAPLDTEWPARAIAHPTSSPLPSLEPASPSTLPPSPCYAYLCFVYSLVS